MEGKEFEKRIYKIYLKGFRLLRDLCDDDEIMEAIASSGNETELEMVEAVENADDLLAEYLQFQKDDAL